MAEKGILYLLPGAGLRVSPRASVEPVEEPSPAAARERGLPVVRGGGLSVGRGAGKGGGGYGKGVRGKGAGRWLSVVGTRGEGARVQGGRG